MRILRNSSSLLQVGRVANCWSLLIWLILPVPLLATDESVGKADLSAQGADVVLDKSTGLLWQRKDSGQPLDWQVARNYCSTAHQGTTSWRLPNYWELYFLYRGMTLKEKDHRDPIFGWSTPPTYWSSTNFNRYEYGNVYVWEMRVPADGVGTVVSFDNWTMTLNPVGQKFLVRCVGGSVDTAKIRSWADAALHAKDADARVEWLIGRLAGIDGAEVKEALPAIRHLMNDPAEKVREAAKKIFKGIEAKYGQS